MNIGCPNKIEAIDSPMAFPGFSRSEYNPNIRNKTMFGITFS
jgi:hypothetical protein